MQLRTGLLGLTTVVLGLSAGFFVTYQISVMPGLVLVDDLTFVRTMQSINATVRSERFAVIFFGPLPLLVIAAVLQLHRPGLAALLGAAAMLYAGGVLGVTFAGNVPLNEVLATRRDPAEATEARRAFEAPWLSWNAIRTGCVLACFTAAALALGLSGRPPQTA